MTISKKLFLAVLSVISFQYGLHAYDVVGLKTEINQITDYANKIIKLSTVEGTKAALWLNHILEVSSVYYDNTDNYKIIDVAKIINGSGNDEAKIMSLLVLREADKTKKVKAKIDKIKLNIRQSKQVKKAKKQREKNAKKSEQEGFKRQIKAFAVAIVGFPVMLGTLVVVDHFVKKALGNFHPAKIVTDAVKSVVANSVT